MGRKKSERRHMGMIRLDADALGRAKLAAGLMRMSLADYASDVIRKAAEQDIRREAKKLADGPESCRGREAVGLPDRGAARRLRVPFWRRPVCYVRTLVLHVGTLVLLQVHRIN
jgi:hypothetical protein